MNVVAASRPRCLVVAVGLTAGLWGVAAVLADALTAGQPAGGGTGDQGLVRLCLAVLVAVAAWAWLQGLAGGVDAWHGAPAAAAGHHGLRRLALTACGVALAGALGAPAGADTTGPRPDLLSGLPLPDRAEGPAQPAGRLVVVRPGDSLWSLAELGLGPRADDRRVSDRWRAIYNRNRGVIGPDPDLIRPGQVLHLNPSSKEHQ